MESTDRVRPSIFRRAAWILPLLILALLVNGLYIDWGLPSFYSWAPDAIHPFMVINAMEQNFSGGWHDKYPPLQYMLNGLVFLPVLSGLEEAQVESIRDTKEAFFSNPSPSQQLISSPVDKGAMSALFVAGRLLNVLMGAFITVGLALAARELFGNPAGWITGLIVAFHPITIFYSHTMNTEAPYFMWSAFGLYCWFRALKRQDFLSYAGLGLFAALATATKEQAFGLFALMPLVLVYARAAKQCQGKPGPLHVLKALGDKHILAGAGIFIIATLLANNLVFNFKGYLDHVAFNAPGVSVMERVYPWTIAGCFGLVRETTAWIIETSSWPVFSLCILGLAVALWRDRRMALAILLPAFSYFVVFLLYIGFVTPRYTTPIFFVLALFGGKLLMDLCRLRDVPRPVRVLVVAVALIYIAGMGLGVNLMFRDDARYEAESWMGENIPAGSSVIAFASPNNMVCRLPEGPKYYPILRIDQVDLSKKLLDKQRADYLVVHVFASNLLGHDPTEWQQGFRDKFKRLGYDLVELKTARWAHPAGRYLFLNPTVFIARRVKIPG